jgi:hypothetical protein
LRPKFWRGLRASTYASPAAFTVMGPLARELPAAAEDTALPATPHTHANVDTTMASANTRIDRFPIPQKNRDAQSTTLDPKG